ncbi:P2X purinoceptor 3a isoform X2 [Myxocyprinus asiaticus]|uniref:P2X purinoceptor 3a isoform X2 n=1 Tax=Myxocyprinus asiaticus TaxID=70543 RepID=UPI0022231A81|nr:P2X purinoceptor 3a isoform X2 [Myxocyprinus asiaticus]
MAPRVLRCVIDFFGYETTKSVVVKSWSVGIINRVIQLLIILYFICWVFLHEKAYQVRDSGIESAVMTKVKGLGSYPNRVMDVADYVAPPQGSSAFSIITKLVVTANQTQGRCPEIDDKFTCTTDDNCTTKSGLNFGNGIVTGTCLINNSSNINNTKGHCEIQGWCPAENDRVPVSVMEGVEDFTIFIKNSVRFPLFNVTRGNFPSSINETYIKNCRHDPIHHPFCPIFKLGDILKHINQYLSNIASEGGEIGIKIGWKCDFDYSVEMCNPQYTFSRLDAVFEKSNVSKGYNFRFAKYYQSPDGTEYRTLHKAYAIRFEIIVSGNAGKFSAVPFMINLVAAFTSVGLATVFCDIILLNFLKGAEQYKAKKFEEVSGIETQSVHKRLYQRSHMSLKVTEKNSDDSGTFCIRHQE